MTRLYRKWHQHPIHPVAHWGVFTTTAIFLTFALLSAVDNTYNSVHAQSVSDVTCSGNITSALQSAINSAVDGGIINIGAGNCSAGTVSWSNKNITVQGQGIGITTVSGLNFDVLTTTKANFRITGMSVGCPSTQWKVNADNRTTGIKGWRIDHVEFSCGGCTQNLAIQTYGITWGLIDNNIFSGMGNAIFMTSWAEGTDEVNPWPPSGHPGMGGYAWLLPLNLGSDEAVYVEDNSFTMPTGCYFGVGDMYYGSRMVFRHNSVLNAYWQNHSARGHERGGSAKAEIYNNDFNATDSNWARAVHIRSGTGLVFNNTLRGFFTTMNVDNQRSDGSNTSNPFGACNGTRVWDGNVEAGWPCLDQIGRAPGSAYPNQISEPLYAWGNGSAIGCSTGGECTVDRALSNTTADSAVQAGRDYINNGSTPKPSYTPYTYPHPLRSEAGEPEPEPEPPSPPLTPTNLTGTSSTSTQINLSWSTSTGATGYRLNGCQTTSGNCNTQIATTSSTTYTHTNLTPSTTYRYRVRAFNDQGNSSYTSHINVTTLSIHPPPEPEPSPPPSGGGSSGGGGGGGSSGSGGGGGSTQPTTPTAPTTPTSTPGTDIESLRVSLMLQIIALLQQLIQALLTAGAR